MNTNNSSNTPSAGRTNNSNTTTTPHTAVTNNSNNTTTPPSVTPICGNNNILLSNRVDVRDDIQKLLPNKGAAAVLTNTGWILGEVIRSNKKVSLRTTLTAPLDGGILRSCNNFIEPLPLPNKIYFDVIPLKRLPQDNSIWPEVDLSPTTSAVIGKSATKVDISQPIRRPKHLAQQAVALQSEQEKRYFESLDAEIKMKEVSASVVQPPVPVGADEQDGMSTVLKEETTLIIYSPEDDELDEELVGSQGSTIADVMQRFTSKLSGEENILQMDGVRNFLQGHSSSLPVAQLKGAHLTALLSQKSAVIPGIAWEGLAERTHQEHLRYLRTIGKAMSDRLQRAHLATAILETIMALKRERGWRYSTTLKTAASLQGCLSLLPLYIKDASRITLMQDVVWQQGMRTLQRACKEEKPNQPTPATMGQLFSMVNSYYASPRKDVATALLLGWLTAARLGCILQLRSEDIAFNSDSSITITFRRGKSVRTRGPYTVHATHLPAQYLKELKEYVSFRDTKIFPNALTGDKMRIAIKEKFPNLEQRSLRRGALQLMASQGVSEESLMRYSGHTRVQTLHRYLNWNAVNSKVQGEMQRAGKGLIPTPMEE